MRIINNDTETRSWFIYNYEDTAQAVALASGSIDPNGTKDYEPPSNGSGMYTVVIKRDAGGGSIMAVASGASGATFTFNGKTLVVS